MSLPILMVVAAYLLTGCLAFDLEYLGDLPIENPELFGGDIIGIEDVEDKSATVKPDRLWPDGVVPYTLDSGLKDVGVTTKKVETAMSIYHKNTCIKFVERTTESNYVRLFPGEGCYSYVGRAKGQQPVSLGKGCGWIGTILHELGHAIGFYHEQSRSDRDDWIIIYWDNIKEGLANQFLKLKPEQNQLLTDFDYDSVMLYGSYTFSKDKKNLKTMEGKGGIFLKKVSTKKQLSKNDIKRINLLYKCNKTH